MAGRDLLGGHEAVVDGDPGATQLGANARSRRRAGEGPAGAGSTPNRRLSPDCRSVVVLHSPAVTPDVDIAPYEGLIFSTAARYAPLLDDDLEDVQQILRIKVWNALRAFDPKRSRAGVKSYVFSCVRNQVKDLLKSQTRRREARNGNVGSVDAFSEAAGEPFEARYLSVTADEAYALVEDEAVLLPSTLTELEGQVVALLVMDYSTAEIAKHLGVTRSSVTTAHVIVQEKMADWHPGHGVRAEVPTQVAA